MSETTQLIDLDAIEANPYQTRASDDVAHIHGLAIDIAQRGLLQAPMARPIHGEGTVRYQLAFGHSRKTAMETLALWSRDETLWQSKGLPAEKCNPAFWNAMPVNVRTLTDREMAEAAIVENAKRQDISAIEKAKAIKRYCVDFKVSQKIAAPLFGLKDASSVSHLLSLLDLPPDVQTLVDTGKLPEAPARMLITVSKYWPQQVITAAHKIAKADDTERAAVARLAIAEIWNNHALSLRNLPWDEKWSPDAKLSTDMYRADKGEPALPPPCLKCEFAHQFGNQSYCARSACYHLKFRIHAVQEAKRAAKKLGIAVAQPDESVSILMEASTGYAQLEKMQKVIRKAARLPSLRLVPMTEPPKGLSYYLKDVTGSHVVLLGTTNQAEINRFLSAGDAKTASPANETLAQKQARVERETRDAEERYAERCTALATKYDVLWMLEYVANECAKQMTVAGGILVKTETLVHVDATYNTQIAELAAIHKRLSAQVFSKMWNGYAEASALPKNDPPEIEHLRRVHIIFDLLAAEVLGHRNASETFKWSDAQTKTERIITRGLLLNLPKDWNVPPVHRTQCNCWHCGKFAGNENGITKKEQAAGWVTDTLKWKDTAAPAVFCCQAHREEFYQAHATANGSAKKGKAKK